MITLCLFNVMDEVVTEIKVRAMNQGQLCRTTLREKGDDLVIICH